MSDASSTPAGLATGVSSRFVSSKQLEEAQAKRQEEWKAAYARLGQEPPKEVVQESYDPRSLFERLQENKNKKQEAFEEQLKFKNQFRALDEDEINFLDSMIDDTNDEERERKRLIDEEMRAYKQAVTARSAPPPPPASLASLSSLAAPSASTSSSSVTPAPIPSSAAALPLPVKKKGKGKKTLAGVVIGGGGAGAGGAGKKAAPSSAGAAAGGAKAAAGDKKSAAAGAVTAKAAGEKDDGKKVGEKRSAAEEERPAVDGEGAGTGAKKQKVEDGAAEKDKEAGGKP